MSNQSTVHVSGIAPATSEKDVRDFFSFCGKIVSLSITPVSSEADAQKSASVTFEKQAAAKTALLLDQTQLGSSSVHVESASNIDDLAGEKATANTEKEDDDELSQEDKPRSRIVAEYLAQGYVVSDNAIQKAIALDQKHGFSNRFTSVLSNFDKKFSATDRAKGLDESYQITSKAQTGWSSLHSYFEKALEHPSGRKLLEFYSQTDKQVRDIHNEARRLADLKQGKSESATTGETAGVVPASAPVAEAAGAAPPAEPKA